VSGLAYSTKWNATGAPNFHVGIDITRLNGQTILSDIFTGLGGRIDSIDSNNRVLYNQAVGPLSQAAWQNEFTALNNANDPRRYMYNQNGPEYPPGQNLGFTRDTTNNAIAMTFGFNFTEEDQTLFINTGVQARGMHFWNVNVGVGQIVNSGVRLGRLGSVGYSTGPHYHWEMNTMPGKQTFFDLMPGSQRRRPYVWRNSGWNLSTRDYYNSLILLNYLRSR
jgi:hypothetical protein